MGSVEEEGKRRSERLRAFVSSWLLKTNLVVMASIAITTWTDVLPSYLHTLVPSYPPNPNTPYSPSNLAITSTSVVGCWQT